MKETKSEEPLIKSKSQVKREMLALQKLGEALVKLNNEQLKKIPLDAVLLDAILQAKAITSHIARRRQLQYIGKLMRRRETAEIEQAFLALKIKS